MLLAHAKCRAWQTANMSYNIHLSRCIPPPTRCYEPASLITPGFIEVCNRQGILLLDTNSHTTWSFALPSASMFVVYVPVFRLHDELYKAILIIFVSVGCCWLMQNRSCHQHHLWTCSRIQVCYCAMLCHCHRNLHRLHPGKYVRNCMRRPGHAQHSGYRSASTFNFRF